MKTFAVSFVCFQVLLVQNVFGQYANRAAVEAPGLAPYGWGSPGQFSPAIAASPFGYGAGFGEIAYPGLSPYGGIGEGNVAVAGELPVAGNTAVVGQVPIMGAVNFGGVVPAAGAVAINGQCSCGYDVPYYY